MTDEQQKQRDYHTGRKIVNGSDVKQRIDGLYDQIVALLEREINHDLQGYEVANSVCQRLATRLCDINVAYLLPRALEDKLSASCTKVTSRTGDLTAKASAALT
jgi:hypothetical protein